MGDAFVVCRPESPQAAAMYDLLVQVVWISAAIFLLSSRR